MPLRWSSTGEDGGGRDGERDLNATLAQVAIDYGFAIELCAARSPSRRAGRESGRLSSAALRARFADLRGSAAPAQGVAGSVNEEQ